MQSNFNSSMLEKMGSNMTVKWSWKCSIRAWYGKSLQKYYMQQLKRPVTTCTEWA